MITPNNKVILFFDRAMAGSFYALIFFLPISNAMVEAFTVLALLSYFIKRGTIFVVSLQQQKPSGLQATVTLFLKSFAPPPNPLNKPIAAWMAVCLFSVLISERPALSFHGFLGKVLQNAFLFFNFVEAIRTPKRLQHFLLALATSSFWVSLSGLNQYFFGVDFIRLNVMEHNRINSTFRAANDFAAYLVATIPIWLALLALPTGEAAGQIRKRGKIALAVVGVLAVICLGLTYSRGGWLSLGFGLGLLALLKGKYFKRIALGIAAFLGIFILKMVHERHYIAFSNLFGSFGRTTYWSEALKIIALKPFFGFGLNTYSVIGKRYSEGWGGYPHNCYLQMTAEIGLIGLLSFLWILFALYRSILRALRGMLESRQRALLIGTAAGLTGFFIHSAFDTFFYSVQLGSLMWVLMGLAVRVIAIEET